MGRYIQIKKKNRKIRLYTSNDSVTIKENGGTKIKVMIYTNGRHPMEEEEEEITKTKKIKEMYACTLKVPALVGLEMRVNQYKR